MLEREILGKERVPLKDQLLDSILYGFITGIVGSIIIVGIGISIDNIGIEYVFPLALILMLINPRYICFSYAGGIVSLVSLLTGFPNINVAGLMAIVGILHLMESILIYIDGAQSSIPLFVEMRDGKIAGGFTMRKFWPIPFVALMTISQISGGQSVNMPNWWPILVPSGDLKDISFILLPVIAALGYGDIALTESPIKRAKTSAIRLLMFSIILTLISIIGSKYYIFKWIAAIFGPLMHEYLIIYGQKEEKSKKLIYEAQEIGAMVLLSIKDSPAYRIGIKPGDIIMKINDIPVNNNDDIQSVLIKEPTVANIIVKENDGNFVNYEYSDCNGIRWLGVIIVQKNVRIVYRMSDMENGGLIGKILNKFRRK